jgi:hypothetical protein
MHSSAMTGRAIGVSAMHRFVKFATGLSAAIVLCAGHAQAATWLVDYTATDGANPTEASVTLELSDVLNAVGGYDVTGISGQVDGDAITGLIANPGQPFPSYSADGWFVFDNVVWSSGAPVLSSSGLLFSGASGDEYNLFSDDASTYELYDARAGVGYVAHSVGAITASEVPLLGDGPSIDSVGVPEASSWAMMIVGFGCIGAVLRHRRRHPVVA